MNGMEGMKTIVQVPGGRRRMRGRRKERLPRTYARLRLYRCGAVDRI